MYIDAHLVAPGFDITESFSHPTQICREVLLVKPLWNKKTPQLICWGPPRKIQQRNIGRPMNWWWQKRQKTEVIFYLCAGELFRVVPEPDSVPWRSSTVSRWRRRTHGSLCVLLRTWTQTDPGPRSGNQEQVNSIQPIGNIVTLTKESDCLIGMCVPYCVLPS